MGVVFMGADTSMTMYEGTQFYQNFMKFHTIFFQFRIPLKIISSFFDFFENSSLKFSTKNSISIKIKKDISKI